MGKAQTKQVQYLQDRLVVVTEEARSNPKLRPVAEAMRSTLNAVITTQRMAAAMVR